MSDCHTCGVADVITVDADGFPACLDCAVYAYIETEENA